MATRTVSTVDGLVDAIGSLGDGDVVVAEPGDYHSSAPITVTTPGLEVRARNDAVHGDGPVSHLLFDSPGDDAVKLRGDRVVFRGFEVSGGDNKGVEIDGGPDNVTVDRVDSHDHYVWGVMTNSGTGHVIRDSVSHDNTGNPGNADGFNGTGSQDCEFVRCEAYRNGDDGFDMWNGVDHLLRDCWAWGSGVGGGNGNGFKLGEGDTNTGGGNRVERCVAYDNPETGFDFNGTHNPDEVVNCTAWGNGLNYHFDWASHYLANNISAGGGGVSIGDQVVHEHNTWNLGIDDPMFVSTDADDDQFLRLTEGSPCVDAGLDVGLPFEAAAPDLGAFEVPQSDNGGNGNGNGNGGGDGGRQAVMLLLVGLGVAAAAVRRSRDG